MEASCPEIEVFQILTQDRSTSMTEQAISPLRRRMITTLREVVSPLDHLVKTFKAATPPT